MIINLKIKQEIGLVATVLMLILYVIPVNAQSPPTIIQTLGFGTFCTGSAGGTISISPAGICTVTGDVIPIGKGMVCSPIIIELDAPVGSRMAILETKSLLKGNSGNTMVLRINGTDPATPFITRQEKTSISIGGTLIVPGSGQVPAGKYTGQLFITFLVGE
ncbi:DUF4402 domain-containing protein [Chitinophaga flava]|nr:DUF4402 domain-containing protein [Chitinophaga flava]